MEQGTFVKISRVQRYFGVGPLGALVSFVFLAIAWGVDYRVGHAAIWPDPLPMRFAGGAIILVGLVFHFWTMYALRNWWAEDRLCTQGPFRWVRHPMYAAWITVILPGFALFLNSWIMICSVVVIHPIWHRLAVREETMMSDKFQNEYRSYAARTGRFFPRIGKSRRSF